MKPDEKERTISTWGTTAVEPEQNREQAPTEIEEVKNDNS